MKSKFLVLAFCLVAVLGIGFYSFSGASQNKTVAGNAEHSITDKSVSNNIARISPEAGEIKKSGKSAWSIRCKEAESSEKETESEMVEKQLQEGNCEVFQRLIVADTGQRLTEFAIGFPGGRETPLGAVILPLGVKLEHEGKPAMKMIIDDEKAYGFRPRYCDQGGCYAFIDMKESVMNDLKSGSTLSFAFMDRNSKSVKVNMDLAGFSNAVAKVKSE